MYKRQALILLIASQVSLIEIGEKRRRYKQEQLELAAKLKEEESKVVTVEHDEDHVGEDGLTHGERVFFKRARTIARQLDAGEYVVPSSLENADSEPESVAEADPRVVPEPVPEPEPVQAIVEPETVESPPVPSSVRTEPHVAKYKVFPRPTKTVQEPEETAQEPVEVDEETQPEPVVSVEEPSVQEEPTTSLNIPSSYIQNEEQQESNLWSSTTTTNTITPEEYLQASNEKLEEHMSNIVNGVKSGNIQMEDIPPILVSEVKARV